MKNIFKKTIASVAALSIMAAGSALTATAATGDVNLNIDDEVKAKAGETVTVNLYSVDAAQKMDSVSFRLQYNPAELKLVNVSSKIGTPELMEREKEGNMLAQVAFGVGKPAELGTEKVVLLSYEFKVNDDAKPGDVYNITWADPASYSFTIVNTTVDRDKNLPYTLDDGGSIVIEGETTTTTTTTTTEPTTEPTTTTTTTEPTTEPTTTTTTTEPTTEPTTTTVTTTTTGTTTTTKAATTTTKKSTTANSPATGNSTEGVAALAATMVAAAGAAVVFKKKKD